MLLTFLCYVGAVVAFLLLVSRLSGKGRCLGWLVGLLCLLGFLLLTGVLH